MVDLSDGSRELFPGSVGAVSFSGLPAREKTVEIWLPYTETVELFALRTDAPVAAAELGGRPVWLHHGSSISQGSAADSSATAWPALAAAAGGVELVNVSLAGSALLDPFTACALRDTPADLISVKIGINLVNRDAMGLSDFGPAVHAFLDTVRDGHPTRAAARRLAHPLPGAGGHPRGPRPRTSATGGWGSPPWGTRPTRLAAS